MRTIKPVKQDGSRKRILSFGVIFSVMFVVIGAKSAYLQIFCDEWLSKKAVDQYEGSFQFAGKRGTIFDKDHLELAVSVETKSLAAHPPIILDPKDVSRKLSKVLGEPYKSIYKQLSANKPFVWIKRQISPKEEKQIRALNLEGVIFKTGNSRFYPNKAMAGQVIGFAGIDGHGLEGLEYAYDKELEGKATHLTVLKDALGRRFESEKDTDTNLNGNNLVLTIDSKIQYVAEKALEEGVNAHAAKSGIALVMEPKTGALLAIAHYPFFNPNLFHQYDREVWRNRAVTDPFEPGSTLKIFSVAAAIDSKLCTANTIFFCENGQYKIGRNVVHDAANHSFGWLSIQQILKYSSNIGAVKIEEHIGPDKLYHKLIDFGFGEKTNVDLRGETPGYLSNYKKWSAIDAGAISFGQGISVSAVQLIGAVSAIANNGILMQPYMVKEIIDSNGRTLKTVSPTSIKRVVSEKTAKAVTAMLKTVLSPDGTGTNAVVDGYSVCGKTGTAQKIGVSGTYEKGKYIASFAGFVPADDPVLTILVIIDEPQNEYYGGVVAAPIFKKIAQEVLYYLNIPPTQDQDGYRVSMGREVRG